MPNRKDLKDLIDAGILQVGEELTCESRRGDVHTAVLNADGSIQEGTRSFTSPFAWSTYLNPNKRDGWRTVHARGRMIRFFREKLENSLGRQTEEVTAASQDGSQEDGDDSYRRYILGLTPSQFQELAREYMKAKGFDDSEMEITMRIKA